MKISTPLIWDRWICHQLNRLSHFAAIRAIFVLFSKLGDGPLWILAILLLPLFEPIRGSEVAVQLALVSLVGLMLYRAIKHRTKRARPFHQMQGIRLPTPALDQYSFPSGHTLHAFAFTIVFTHHYPPSAVILWPMTGMIALSRVILGLHFPTDVIAGMALGSMLAVTCINMLPV